MQKVRQIISGRYFWVIAAITLIVSRFSTWLFPYDSDHWIFYYMGRKWFDGGVLYLDMWDHKSPLIYGYNAIIHSLFGANIVLHRIVFTLVAIVGIYLFYKVAIELLKHLRTKNLEFIARISTLLFIFLSSLAQFTNSGNNNENLAIPFLLGMLWLYLIYRRDPIKYQNALIGSGLLAGFVFFLKANFSAFILPIVIDLVYIHRKQIIKIVTNLCLFGFGIVLQLLVWAFYFERMHTFKEFYIATFQFNSKYIRALGWDLHAPSIKIFIGILVLLLILFIPFLLKALRQFAKPDKNLNYFIPLLASSTILFVVLAGTFYSHYFLIVIPYFCLLFAVTARQFFNRRCKLKIFGCLLILILLFLISLKLGVYNTYRGTAATDFNNQKLAAQYIKEHTDTNDKIFANIYGATFYQLVGRDSGSRYISASHPLIDYKYRFGYNFNVKLIFDMEDSLAKYIVMSSDNKDIYRTENPVLMRYINHNYTYETTVGGYDIYRRNV